MERGFKTRCENLALQLRSELRLKKTDPLTPEQLAEHLSVIVVSPDDLPGLSEKALRQLHRDRDSWSAVTVSYLGIEIIIFNSLHSDGRQSTDMMHELAHILLKHRPFEMVFFSDKVDVRLREYDAEVEEEANWLAGCLLLPRDVLLWIKNRGLSDIEACELYRVNKVLLNYRMNRTGVNRQVANHR